MTKKFVPQQKNANKHTLHGLRLLEKSIQQDGFIDAQTAAADGEIISGSARLELSAEKFAGVEPIIVESDGTRPVVVVRTDIPDATDPRARRLSIAANQIGHTDWNPDGELLREWGNEDADIKAMFAADEWREVTGEEKPSVDAEPQTDRAAELLEKWGVKPGDLWQIGDHRLICGDCTDAATVARVMGGEKAGLVFTDPPYKFETKGSGYFGGENRPKVMLEVEDAGIADFDPAPFLDILPSVFRKDMHASFIFCNKELLLDYLAWAKGSKISSNVLVWHKKKVTPFGAGHVPDIEYLVYLRKSATWNDGTDANRSKVLEYEQDNEVEEHPTVKPVPLIQNQLILTTAAGDVVVDFYCGSGSTLIACQNLSRRCRAIEISPAYVAVALERMATAFPGIDIRRLE